MKKLLAAIIEKFYPDAWVTRTEFDQLQEAYNAAQEKHDAAIELAMRNNRTLLNDFLNLNKLLPKASDKRGTLSVGVKMERRPDFSTAYSLTVADDQIRSVPKKIQPVVIDQLTRVLVEHVKQQLTEKLVEAEA